MLLYFFHTTPGISYHTYVSEKMLVCHSWGCTHTHTQHACLQLPGLPSFLVRGWSESVLFPVGAPIVTHCEGLSTCCLFFFFSSSPLILLHFLLSIYFLSRSMLSLSPPLAVMPVVSNYHGSVFPQPLHYIQAVITVYLLHLLPLLSPTWIGIIYSIWL